MTELPRADPSAVAAFQAAISGAATDAAVFANRFCPLRDYEEISVPFFDIDGEFVAYASPEATYAVTKAFMQAAQESMLIGIYDFSAGYMKELLLQAMQRGVTVTLMLDLVGDDEAEIFQELKRFGCEAVPAPSCASARAQYFPSAHEKVIVIDDTWTLVQSGNYSRNSIPQNEGDGGDPDDFSHGNRDTGLAIRSAALAAFLRDRLRADIQLELDGAEGIAVLSELALAESVTLLQAAPREPPPRLFPSKRFSPASPIRVTPVLSPDNYMAVVPDVLAAAERSIVVEEQYIRGGQPAVRRLLTAIREARDRAPDLDMRVVLAMPFPGRDFEEDAQEIRDLGVDFGLDLGRHVRLLNPRHFVHCHNKLIVVDDEIVLVGSQNWSDFAVTKNREVSLLMHYPELARYYAAIVELDWETGLSEFPPQAATVFFATEALPAGGLVPLSVGDYADV
jgi:phosphatidylserine/phosphatidylglycerophosphate/cardiolipin synthase-like enzyme